jgi:predicted nuclease with TOPRIM domain
MLLVASLRAEVEKKDRSMTTIHEVSDTRRRMFEDAHNECMKRISENAALRAELDNKQRSCNVIVKEYAALRAEVERLKEMNTALNRSYLLDRIVLIENENKALRARAAVLEKEGK